MLIIHLVHSEIELGFLNWQKQSGLDQHSYFPYFGINVFLWLDMPEAGKSLGNESTDCNFNHFVKNSAVISEYAV